MQPLVRMIRLTVLAPAALLSLVLQAQSEKTNTSYPSMAPIDRYLIPDASAEISLAKSAAPKSISDSAAVILLKRQSVETWKNRNPGSSNASPVAAPTWWASNCGQYRITEHDCRMYGDQLHSPTNSIPSPPVYGGAIPTSNAGFHHKWLSNGMFRTGTIRYGTINQRRECSRSGVAA